MKQTTLTQRLLSALVALCMVLSVCAPALAAEPEIGSAAMITLTKGGTTTDLKMPEGNVSLSAAYRETYQIRVKPSSLWTVSRSIRHRQASALP